MISFSRTIFCLLSLGTCAALCSAAEPDTPKTMTKMVTRLTGEGTKSDPAAGRPKTLYRAGKKYSRLEEERDPDRSIHRLIVTNEPESWVINLEEQTALHVLDKGPDFNTRLPIFWDSDGKPDADFGGLEFGEEIAFFGEGHARNLGWQKVEGRTCKALSITSGQKQVILYLERKTNRPYQIDLVKSGRPSASIRYLSYDAEVPFDASIFEPPKGVMIMPSEAGR